MIELEPTPTTRIAVAIDETRSKAEQGYRLLGAATDVPLAVTITLNRDMTVETDLQHPEPLRVGRF